MKGAIVLYLHTQDEKDRMKTRDDEWGTTCTACGRRTEIAAATKL